MEVGPKSLPVNFFRFAPVNVIDKFREGLFRFAEDEMINLAEIFMA